MQTTVYPEDVLQNVPFLSIERVELPVWHKRAVLQKGVLEFAAAAPIQIAFCGKSFYSRVRSFTRNIAVGAEDSATAF
jgi:hypothetical protein